MGGGIYAESGAHLTIIRSLIDGNSADVEGGGIFNDGSLTIDRHHSGEHNGGYGGGVANNQGGSDGLHRQYDHHRQQRHRQCRWPVVGNRRAYSVTEYLSAQTVAFPQYGSSP